MGSANEPSTERESRESSAPLGLRDLAIVLRDDFNMAAVQLDKHARNVNVTRVAGGSAAVAGGVTAIVGFALIPVTMGMSAVVAGVTGAAIAAGGGLTAGGASVAKIFIEKFKLRPLLAKWSDFNDMLRNELQEQDPEASARLREERNARMLHLGSAGIAATSLGASAGAARAGVSAARASATGATAAAEAGGAAARLATAAAAGSIVLNAVLVGISLYDIIDGSIQLHEQRGCQAGDYLRQLARSLDEFARTGLSEELLMADTQY